jgi:hypothetical protein
MDIYNMDLSDNFTLAEALVTEHREIDNTVIDQTVLDRLRRTALKVEKVRHLLDDNSIRINSWYRCLELNRALKSKDTSDHIKGQAVDFICPKFGTPLQIAVKLREFKELLGFKQLIMEHTWVHISWELEIPNTQPKLEILSLVSGGHYASGFTDLNGKTIA